MSAEIPTDSHLPLTESTFLILLSLSSGPKHGYAMMKDVQHLSHQRIVLSTGTLYGALKRLLEQGWIERSVDPSTIDRQQKAYMLTEQGRRILAAEAARMQALVMTAIDHRVLREA